MSKITITNQSGPVAVVDIEGIIGVPESWQFDEPGQRVATYETFRRTVESLAEVRSPEVIVNIRSTGGNVNDALLIYDAITALQGRITTRCFGYVASAATIIAQAASPGCREVSSNSLYLIHKSVGSAEGNTEQMTNAVGMLEQTDARIAAVYAERSGKPIANFETLMCENSGNGRWLAPEEVLAAGLADRIISGVASTVDTKQTAAIGLPPVPSSDSRWNAILEILGLRRREAVPAAVAVSPEPSAVPEPPMDVMARAQNEMSDAHRKHIAELKNRIDYLESQNARLSIGPTATNPKEDPSPQEVRRTPNEEAYLADVKRFN